MGDATKLWSETEDVVENVTNGVNFYNILNHDKDDARSNHISHQREHTFTSPHVGKKIFKVFFVSEAKIYIVKSFMIRGQFSEQSKSIGNASKTNNPVMSMYV